VTHGERLSEQPFRLGQLVLTPLTLDGAVESIMAAAVAEESCIVVTSNINHLMLAEKDAAFRDAVAAARWNLVDGWPLVAASRLFGSPAPERVAGIDLVARLLGDRRGVRLAVLGGPAGAAATLAERRAGVHEVVLVESLERGTWESDEAIRHLGDTLARARPNLVLIGIGPPKQELLAVRLLSSASGPIICCGAALEVLAGMRPRAPVRWQRLGLEWAWRLRLEPARLGPRYATAALWFVRITGRDALARARQRVAGRRRD
jgi:N-acetylglucosaminyldiphosphoundecaprenol N-acetyl-beta-D-mannosaminyltransferase